MVCIAVTVMDIGYLFASSTGIRFLTISGRVALVIWIIGILLTLIGANFLAFCRVRKQRQETLTSVDGKPDLWFRSMARENLTDPRMPENRHGNRRVAWAFNVNLANTSPVHVLGIHSIILQVPHAEYTEELRPYVGQLSSDFGTECVGDIPDWFLSQPSEAKTGTLLFLEKRSNCSNDNTWDETRIVVTDSQGNEYRFPTKEGHFTSR